MKKTRFLFDSPVSRDWLFYVFLVFLAGNIYNGLANVSASGGLTLSSAGIVSGLIDGALRITLSWFPVIPLIYLIRKQIRKSIQDKSQDM